MKTSSATKQQVPVTSPKEQQEQPPTTQQTQTQQVVGPTITPVPAPFGSYYHYPFGNYPHQGGHHGPSYGHYEPTPCGHSSETTCPHCTLGPIHHWPQHQQPWFGQTQNWFAPQGCPTTQYGYPGYYGTSMTPFDGFDRMFRDLDRTFTSELNFQPARPSSMIEHYSLTSPIRYDAEGNRSLNCYFDLRSYKPEEVNVTLDTKDRSLNVEASHEVKDKDHYIKRHYSRKVYIPEECKVDLAKLDVKSCLTNEGVLCVEAPLPKLRIEEARQLTSAGKTMASHPAFFKVTTKTI